MLDQVCRKERMEPLIFYLFLRVQGKRILQETGKKDLKKKKNIFDF